VALDPAFRFEACECYFDIAIGLAGLLRYQLDARIALSGFEVLVKREAQGYCERAA
jgi:hypothetical protein